MPEQIPTLKQFADRRRREKAQRTGTPLAAFVETEADDTFKPAWLASIRTALAAGAILRPVVRKALTDVDLAYVQGTQTPAGPNNPSDRESGAAPASTPAPPANHRTRPRPLRIIGVDPSLTGTGVASTAEWARTLKPRDGDRDHARIAWICGHVAELTADADLVVIEGPAYSKQAQPGHHEAAGLWWLLTHALWHRGVPIAVVSPTTLKLYATGNGGATKQMMLRAAGRMPWFAGDHNAADATLLAAAGAQRRGRPILTVPDKQREALDAATWPDLGGMRTVHATGGVL